MLTPIKKLYMMSFLYSLGWYSVVPFFALYLINVAQAPPIYIGFVLSLNYIAYTLVSFKVGQLIDRFSPQSILKIACLLLATAFVLLYFFFSLWFFAVINILIGIFCSMYRTSTSVLLKFYTGDNSHDAYNKLYAFFNVGVSVGALLGALLFNSNTLFALLYCAGIFFVLGYFALSLPLKKIQIIQWNKIKLRKILCPFILYLLMGGIIYSMIFAQLNTTLPMLLHATQSNSIFAYVQLLIINTIVIVLLQYPLKKLRLKISVFSLCGIGVIATICSLLLLSSNNIYWLYIAMVFFTIGEAILLPLFNSILVAKAPSGLYGSYIGLFSLSNLGSFMGTFLGGIFFQIALPNLFYKLLVVMMVVCFICVCCASRSLDFKMGR